MKHFLLFFTLLSMTAPLPAQDPDIAENERAAIEEFFRSSDLPGETPVGRRGKQKRVSVPEGAARVGCVCMDDTPSDAHSIGACSGHGGVRYWLYRTREGDTLQVLTARHEFHPHPLDSLERSQLTRPKEKGRASAGGSSAQPTVIVIQQPVAAIQPATANEQEVNWPATLGVGAGGMVSVWLLRLLLLWTEKQLPHLPHALRHLLRHRKRPPARKNGKNTRPPRV